LRHAKAKSSTRARRRFTALFALLLAIAQVTPAADLQPTTVDAFNRYAQLTQAEFDAENTYIRPFLWIDSLPDDKRKAAYAQLQAGQVVIERLQTLDNGKPIPVPGGMIHHWIGTVFISGATLAQVLAFEEDYDHQQRYFSPDVIRSKILSHKGPDFTIKLRFYKKKIITAVLDTQHQIHYATIDPTHAWSASRTTLIQQVQHPGDTTETLEPEGHDDGFLWRMNTYWRFEEKDGGTYVESQSISLTRDIPTGLGWMIGPYITSVPRESLTFTLAATRNSIMQRIGKRNLN
jgi:hypothetical protein